MNETSQLMAIYDHFVLKVDEVHKRLKEIEAQVRENTTGIRLIDRELNSQSTRIQEIDAQINPNEYLDEHKTTSDSEVTICELIDEMKKLKMKIEGLK